MSVKRVTSKKPYLLTRDDDGHWYLIPYVFEDEFRDWVENEDIYYEDLGKDAVDFAQFRINGPHTLKIYSWSDDQ